MLRLSCALALVQLSPRHGYTFRKEGYTKIIEYDLTAKQKAQHDAIGLRRPNVMLDEQKSKAQAPVQANGRSGDSSDEDMSSDEEEEGEDVFSNDEGEEGYERPANGQSLPKSASGKTKTSRGRNERVMPPEECRAHLRRLFRNESVMCSLLFGRHGPFADRKSTRLNSSHSGESRMPSSA